MFVAEMIWKLIAFGPLTYAKSRWNVFDAIIVTASVAGYLTASGGSFSIFRSLRLVIRVSIIPDALFDVALRQRFRQTFRP